MRSKYNFHWKSKTTAIFDKIFFSHAGEVIAKAKHKIIGSTDIPPLPKVISPDHLWNVKDSLEPSSEKTFFRTTLLLARRQIGILSVFTIVRAIFVLALPLIIHKLVGGFARADSNSTTLLTPGIFYAFLAGIATLGSGLCLQHSIYWIIQGQQIIESVLNARIFSHTLSISTTDPKRAPVGEIVNHISTDSMLVGRFVFCMNDALYILLMLVGGTMVIWKFLGGVSLLAVLVLIVMSPVSKWLGNKFVKIEDYVLQNVDKRINKMTQILNGIKIIKYCHWMLPSFAEVKSIRDEEQKSRKELVLARTTSTLIYISTASLMCLCCFGCFVMLGHQLTPEIVLASSTVFLALQEPFGEISFLLSTFASARVSSERIRKFLNTTSIQHRPLAKDILQPSHDLQLEVCLNHVTVQAPDSSNKAPLLKDLSLTFTAGKSYAIIGEIGSGKSVLLSALLGEFPVESGSISFTNPTSQTLAQVPPRFVYVPQEAFVLNSSLKDNLTFGNTCSDDEVNQAVFLAGLLQDLEKMPAGLTTEIGEKGLNLSGGQKQRVSLARAILGKGNLILLDDPLSAVDGLTEKFLVENLVFGHWKNHTRIIVTHKLSFLDKFDEIILMEKGEVVAKGDFAFLKATSQAFNTYYSHEVAANRDTLETEARLEQGKEIGAQKSTEESRITCDEERETGAVPLSIYANYFNSLIGKGPQRYALCAALIGSLILWRGINFGEQIWLVNMETFLKGTPPAFLERVSQTLSNVATFPLGAIAIYAALCLCEFFAMFGQTFLWQWRSLRAASELHDKALLGVLHAPINFFERNPVGRILNRFSRDMDMIDEIVGHFYAKVALHVVNIAVVVAFTMWIIPPAIVVFIGIAVIYFRLQHAYRKASREVKRLFSLSFSPRFAQFKETLQGLSTVRAFAAEEVFTVKFKANLAHGMHMLYGNVITNRWFSCRIPLLGGTLTASLGILLIFACQSHLLSVAAAGLLFTWILNLDSHLNLLIRDFCELEACMTSSERLLEYANLETEPEVLAKSPSPHLDNWPSQGAIEFDNVHARYGKHLPYVLQGVNFQIKGGSRVGIVGKTGCGKSTLLQALYRFVEIPKGQVKIDGIDIASVPLSTLRKALAIIPQEPVLFEGTLRSNLDRFGTIPSEKIYAVLDQVQMAEYVRSLPEGIETKIEANATDFSQGQKQLLCLARALLTGAKIIVMDEPTANVDIKTDAAVQQALSTATHGVTLLIIAHRLNTVKECDSIIDMNTYCAV